MRQLLIAILTFICFGSSGQTEQTKIFKTIEYINGNFYRQSFDTVKISNEKIDIYFLKHHFYSPYYLPVKFIDKQYRNQKISIWGDPKGKKDYKLNYENTYAYDSLGRLINFTYSGCFVCSSFPYSYRVTYNSEGQVEQIFNLTNVKDGFKFYYNAKGDIVQFEKFLQDKLETVIALVN
jgi:hypothetical protein